MYPIMLDKPRNLRYGMRAIKMIENALGKSAFGIELNDMTMDEIATFIWAGLYHEDKEITPDEVIDLVDEHSDLPTALLTMAKAFGESFGKGKAAGPNAQRATKKAKNLA